MLSLNITFKSTDGKNFGKPNSDVEVAPIKIKFTQNWQLDENGQKNEVVGAVLEPLETNQNNILKIDVRSGCNDPERCNCQMAFRDLTMDLDNQADVYLIGSDATVVFELALQNTGEETSLDNVIKIESTSKLPKPNSIGTDITNLKEAVNKGKETLVSFFSFFKYASN